MQGRQVTVVLQPIDEVGRHLASAGFQEIKGLVQFIHLGQAASKIELNCGVVRLDDERVRNPFFGSLFLTQ